MSDMIVCFLVIHIDMVAVYPNNKLMYFMMISLHVFSVPVVLICAANNQRIEMTLIVIRFLVGITL